MMKQSLSTFDSFLAKYFKNVLKLQNNLGEFNTTYNTNCSVMWNIHNIQVKIYMNETNNPLWHNYTML